MGLAEKKVELLQIVASADEELTGKLIEVAKQYTAATPRYTQEELEMFHTTRNKYLSSGHNTVSLKDAHTYIRSLKKK